MDAMGSGSGSGSPAGGRGGVTPWSKHKRLDIPGINREVISPIELVN